MKRGDERIGTLMIRCLDSEQAVELIVSGTAR